MGTQPQPSDVHNPHPCRKCGKQIYWHKSRAGKNYPTDSPTDRRAFHQCEAAAPTPKPTTANIEATLGERVDSLEQQVAALIRTVKEVQARQPLTAQDVGF